MDLHACLPSRKRGRERDSFLRSKLDKRPCAQLAFVDQATVRVLQGKKWDVSGNLLGLLSATICYQSCQLTHSMVIPNKPYGKLN